MKIKYHILPNRITFILLGIVGILLIANLISIYLKWVLGYNTALGFVPLFNFDQEYNLPTFYSSLALLFSAMLLFMISKDKQHIGSANNFSIQWKILGYVFVFLALDELMGIHEQCNRLVDYLIDASGYLNPSRYWIVAYVPLLLIFVIGYFRFLLHLPNKTKMHFFAGGFIFVTGAIGFEILGDRYISYHDTADINYALLYTAEELFEMLGIVVFIRGLVEFIGSNLPNPNLRLDFYFLSSHQKIVERAENLALREEIKEQNA